MTWIIKNLTSFHQTEEQKFPRSTTTDSRKVGCWGNSISWVGGKHGTVC